MTSSSFIPLATPAPALVIRIPHHHCQSRPITMPAIQAPRPIQRFATAVSKCTPEAAVYGKCVVADYNSVHKDQCAKEFMKLKDCYLAASKGAR
ncbi:hypothetical protein B0H66DRAFT_563679 [Apodospora peruviana]|uniref:Uncharacterized protein n=1 Tax=Apodospora peruviana TaxID=516989 RepID=A0AAE0HXV8_9PEZI|nr:hypothetical protein B0H66DRAFT_563679 [Apodospora peruviana]